jgi:hypothetical protein
MRARPDFSGAPTIGRTWLCRQRGRLLERHIARVVARARQRSALGDDGLIDIDSVGRGAVADLAAMGLFARLQSRVNRPTGSVLPPLPLRTTTILPLAGAMPVRARMFAP